MNIFVHRDGTEYGPYSREQIQEYLRDGNFEPNDWARTEELEDWVPLGELAHAAAPASEPEPIPEPKPEPIPEPEPVASSTVTPLAGLPRAVWGGIAAGGVLALGAGAWFLFFKPKEAPPPGPGAGLGQTATNQPGATNGGGNSNNIIVPPAPSTLQPIPLSARYVPANANMVLTLRAKKLIQYTGGQASLVNHSTYINLKEKLDLPGDLLDAILKAPGHHGLDLDQPMHVFTQDAGGEGPAGKTIGVVTALADADVFGETGLPDVFNNLLPGQGDQAREKMKEENGVHTYAEDSKTFALGHDGKAVVILFVERPSPNLKFEIANYFGNQDGLADDKKAGFRELLNHLDDLGYWRKSGDAGAGESFAPPAKGALAPLGTEWAINFKFTPGLLEANAILRHDAQLLAAWGTPDAGLNPQLLKLVPNQPLAVATLSSHMPALRDLVLKQIMPRHENTGVQRHSKAFKKLAGIALADALTLPSGGMVATLTDVAMKLDENNQMHPEFRAILGFGLASTNHLASLLATVNNSTNRIGKFLKAHHISHAVHDNRLILGTGPHTNSVTTGAAANPLPSVNSLHNTLRTNHLAVVVDLQQAEQILRNRTALFRNYPSAHILGDMQLAQWTHLTLTANASMGRVDFRLHLNASNSKLTGFRTLLDSYRENVDFIRKKANEIACQHSINRIRTAMRLWATAKNKPPTAAVSLEDLLPFLQNQIPLCPENGKYFLTTADQPCTCSKHSKKPTLSAPSAEK